jgi:ADP-ribose pyrophosphatase
MTRWRKLGERTLFDDGRRAVIERRFELPDGNTTEFSVKAEADCAAVLALTGDEHVVLVREFRVGPEDVLLELPGGAVEDGEEPLEAARRELLEETGYAGDLVPAGATVDCAYSTRRKHAFVATGCRRVADPRPDEFEFGEVVLLPLADFRAHLRSGRLTDVDVGYLALDALGRL